ncbi:protein MAIN-LIKE 1-like isoform X2 [Gastrolobium bilobum]|nr:protein MAIN-LIKE 1-like isoform X2 [Gastrolobium bilobum]
MEAWSCEKRAFVIGSGEIRMSLLDAALIMGLRVVGDPVVLKEDEPFSDFEGSYEAKEGKRKVLMSFLEERLDSIGEVSSDYFVRTFLLYTIGTFLSSNDGKVDSRYLHFLMNLDEVSRFAWGVAIVEDLAQWLDKRKENNVQYVGGCLIFLQTWCYEHFDIARPQLQCHDLTFPRVCRWDNSKSLQRQRGTSRLKDLHDDQIIWKLQPTSEELQLEIIKEALELVGDNEELQSEENCSINTLNKVPGVGSELQVSVSSKVLREDGDNFENQVVDDTPTRLSSCDEEYREQETNLENLIVLDTPPNLSICDEVNREKEMNLVNLIVLDSPPNLSICDEVNREHEMNLGNRIVEDTPTNLSIADEVGREQEFSAEKFKMNDTPPKSSFYDDDLRKKSVMLEEENAQLKMKIGQVMEENELLRRQILSNTQFEEQNAELKKELDFLREELRILRLSESSFLDRMDRHILDYETDATAKTCYS